MAKKVSKKGKGSYLKYRSEARLGKNKAKRAAVHEKRMARFRKRREEGKNYKYIPFNPEGLDEEEISMELYNRAHKNISRKTEVQRVTSALRKIDNYLADQKEKLKIKNKV